MCVVNLEIGIMKLGQFMCLGNLQRLKNRFGTGYAVQVKLPLPEIEAFKQELVLTLPGVQFDGKSTLIFLNWNEINMNNYRTT